jgi:hypothetical protein
MKNKILATLVAFGLVGSASAIEINENLSINGFIDTSWNDLEADTTGNDSQGLGLDEIELNFLFNVGNVSGAIHIDNYDDNNASRNGYSEDNGIDIEQAHFTYGLENGVSFTIGKYGSKLGFEREDPSGLYTYSRAYQDTVTSGSAFNLGNVDAYVYEGAAVSYNGEVFSLNLSFHNDGDSNLENDDLDTELSFSYTGIENLVLGGGFLFDNQGNSLETETDIVNVHAAYQTGKFLIAAEYSEADVDGPAINDKRDAYMFLADYSVSDKLAIAVRISANEVDDGSADGVDHDKLTIAPRYAITDSLGAVIEFSDIDVGTEDANLVAVELTYTF